MVSRKKSHRPAENAEALSSAAIAAWEAEDKLKPRPWFNLEKAR